MTTPTLPEAARMALEALDGETPGWRTPAQERAIVALRAALAASEALPKTPPLEWAEAPARTQWGAGMMEALLPLGKDHTLRLYAEREVLHLVPGALAASEAPTPLTDYELTQMAQRASTQGGGLHPWWMILCREVEKRVRQECALDKLAAESQRLGLYEGKPVSGADELAANCYPPIPSHPEHGWVWTAAEVRAIVDYAGLCVREATHDLNAAWQAKFDATHPAAPQQPPVSLLWQVRKALARAAAICDAVPNRQDGHLGALVNAQPDGTHGYREIHEAEAALVAYLTTPEAAPQQPAPAERGEQTAQGVDIADLWNEHMVSSGGVKRGTFDDFERAIRAALAALQQPAQGLALPEAHCASEWGGRPTGPLLYTADEVAALASAPRVPLTREQMAALTIMLDHFAGDTRAACLHSLLAAAPQPEGGA